MRGLHVYPKIHYNTNLRLWLDYHLLVCRGKTNDPTDSDDMVKIENSTVSVSTCMRPLLQFQCTLKVSAY